MPKLTGVYSKFRNIDHIPILDISQWIKGNTQVNSIENFIGNRILYPQTVPMVQADLEIDFAILRETARRNHNIFLDTYSKKLVLTNDFIARFPPLSKLIKALTESMVLPGITTVILKNTLGTNVGGTIVNIKSLPSFNKMPKNISQIELLVDGSKTLVSLGDIVILPIKKTHIKLKLDDTNEIMVAGGDLGVVLDLRI